MKHIVFILITVMSLSAVKARGHDNAFSQEQKYRVVVWKSNMGLNEEKEKTYIYSDTTLHGAYWIYYLEKKNPRNQNWVPITGYNVSTSDNDALKRNVLGYKWGVRLPDDSGEITISCEGFRRKITIINDK